MLAFRYAALAALAVWLGAMAVVAFVVLPAAFGALEAADPNTGRVLAGLTVTEILRRVHLLAYACGAVTILSLVALKFIGPPPAAFSVRVFLTSSMLAMAVYSGMVVSPEIESIQTRTADAISRLPAGHAHRARFDHLHRLSTVLMSVNMGLGALLLVWYARE